MGQEVEDAARRAWAKVEESFMRQAEEPVSHLRSGIAVRRHAQALRMVRAARDEPDLARFFPFTSVGRLCLSRCSDFPFTTDLPGIGAHHEGFYVFSDPYPVDEAAEASTVLITADLDVALQTLIRRLPEDRTTWIGTADGAPRR